MTRKLLLGIVIATAPPACAADALQPLDIKAGLWEITLTVRTSGPAALPAELLAKLTPEDRARVEAKAKEHAGTRPQTTVKRSCLDENARQQPFRLTFGGEDQSCRQTVVNSSRNRQEIRVECGQGLAKGGGTYRIEATDPENVKVSSDWSATDGVRKMKTTSTATLKWLGEICEVNFSSPDTETPATLVQTPAAPARADASFYYKLGKDQTARNDLAQALESLNQAIALDTHQPTSYNARGYVHLRLKNYSDAAADFSEAIRLRPDYINAYQNRAIARRHMGDEQGAQQDNRKAADLIERSNR